MALCKTKSRVIKGDGESFRWVLQEGYGYNSVTVQSAAGKGAKLFAQIAWHSYDQNRQGILGWYEIVTPKLVAGAIRQAKSRGWKPKISGPPFGLRMETGDQAVIMGT